VKEKTNTTPGEDVDEVITNNLLRAESGSKSRWSIVSTLTYNGGSISSPFSEDRPNIAKSTGTIDKAYLDGPISIKYNLDSRNSLQVGLGVRWIAPLSSSGPQNYDGSRFDADNPYLTYQYLYKFFGIQAVLQVQGLAYTNANLLSEGYVGQLQFDQENMYEIGETKISVGASTGFGFQAFNKTGPAAGLDDVRTDQADYLFWIEPCLEYAITDKINFRTVSSLWSFEHTRNLAPGTFRQDKVYQSVGVGFSVTRDIYLFPNVQFLPDDIRGDRTNVALNTNINLF
jgi:hypothetical protein